MKKTSNSTDAEEEMIVLHLDWKKSVFLMLPSKKILSVVSPIKQWRLKKLSKKLDNEMAYPLPNFQV